MGGAALVDVLSYVKCCVSARAVMYEARKAWKYVAFFSLVAGCGCLFGVTC